jgi:hypothetical protein
LINRWRRLQCFRAPGPAGARLSPASSSTRMCDWSSLPGGDDQVRGVAVTERLVTNRRCRCR